MSWFTDQAYNAILLAEDEAHMMNHSIVDPAHLLLAAARRGNAESLLLTRARIAAREIHDEILRQRGFGEKLVLHPRPSLASEEVLSLAVSAALARGVSGPSTEHLLLALGEQEASARILAELGLRDVRPLVDAKYPVTRAPLDQAFVQRRAPRADVARAGGDLLGLVALGQGDQHRVAGGALHQRGDRGGVALADQKVTLPVAGHRAILGLGGPLGDVDHVGDPVLSLPGLAAGLTQRAAGA
jgi:hypothetical protein